MKWQEGVAGEEKKLLFGFHWKVQILNMNKLNLVKIKKDKLNTESIDSTQKEI